MKVRQVSAIVGIALAAGVVIFIDSLRATNDRQATAVAEALIRQVPVSPRARTAMMALDFRPGGRVMQGPPMRVMMAEGAQVETGACVVTKALFAQRRLEPPATGTTLKFVGRNGAYELKLAAVLDWERPTRGYPNVFVAPATAAAIGEEWKACRTPPVEELAAGFRSDAGRNLDRAKWLLLGAAILTALAMLVNSLFLSVEARRKELALLRVVGLTRAGVVRRVLGEAVAMTLAGVTLGCLGAVGSLALYVRMEAAVFPLGLALSGKAILGAAVLSPVVAGLAAVAALRPALAVRPLEAASDRLPRKRHLGMIVAFAFGFGAFVAVEVWGASLMKSFVPSPEWPDAVVSLLPGGTSSFDIEKLRGRLPHVRRIHELQPLQVKIDGVEGVERNVLLLASDWLPEFKFAAGSREVAESALKEGDNCLVTTMMARAKRLRLGDCLELDCGKGFKLPLKVAGIIDLNWHMVTSRGLLRGLGRMPQQTDGPVFVSFDTLAAADPRPQELVKMTHLWLDFEPEFLAAKGAFAAGREVEREIAGILQDDAGMSRAYTVRLHSRDEVADGTLAHGAQLIGAMARIPYFFLAVISLGLVAMLSASATARAREFAVLRAVGATRAGVAMELVKEAVKVAGTGIGLAVPCGSLVGWLATAGTRAAMANWGIPPAFAVPYLTLAGGAFVALLMALSVAVLWVVGVKPCR